jgi:KRAB domain-containing zinc finger protein
MVVQSGPPGVPALFKGKVIGHGDYMMFFCGVCGYSTAYSGRAKRHHLKHTGDKSHSCPYCRYATFRKDILKKHMETHGVLG